MVYDKVRTANKSNEETYKQTLSRIQKIQSHLNNTPRGSRLKDKVCIVTGVGSLKGIGYVRLGVIRGQLLMLPKSRNSHPVRPRR